MKVMKGLINTVVLSTFFVTGSAWAYNAGSVDDRCLAPKFKSFSPPEKTPTTPVPEVAPESEISFTVSGSADPTTIQATAKEIPLTLDIVDRSSFYQVSAQLPAELSGKYVRIHLAAKAQKGDCKSKDGWLIKVKKATPIATPAAPTIDE